MFYFRQKAYICWLSEIISFAAISFTKKKGFEFHLRKMVGVQYFLKTILEGLQTKLLVEDSGGQLQRPGTREMELLGIMKNLFEIRKHEFKKGLGSTILRNLVCVYVRVCVCARGSVSVCFSIIFNCIENQDGIEIALYFTRGVWQGFEDMCNKVIQWMNCGVFVEYRGGWGILKKLVLSKDGRSLQGGKIIAIWDSHIMSVWKLECLKLQYWIDCSYYPRQGYDFILFFSPLELKLH